MAKEATKVIICGGGNGAHVLAGLVSSRANNDVTVLDVYEDETERWNAEMKKSGFKVCLPDKTEIFQKSDNILFTVTRDVKVVAEADVLIFCLPAYGHQTYFDIVPQYLKDTCIVIGMPGHPGFEYQSLHYLGSSQKGCLVLSTETLPWACRISKYGTEVIIQGTKESVMASLMLRGKENVNKTAVVEKIQNLLGEKPVINLVDHFLELTMHTKSSLHPPIMYAKWRNWDGTALDSPPLFYQGIDEEAARYLQAVSDESMAIAEEIAKRCPKVNASRVGSIYDWLLCHYTDQINEKTSLLTAMKTNAAYAGLVHPMKKTEDGKYAPNFDYRYTTEDIPYGLVVFRGIATLLNVPTPVLDEIICWAQKKLGKEFLVDGKLEGKDLKGARLPHNYGLTSFNDLMKME